MASLPKTTTLIGYFQVTESDTADKDIQGGSEERDSRMQDMEKELATERPRAGHRLMHPGTS